MSLAKKQWTSYAVDFLLWGAALWVFSGVLVWLVEAAFRREQIAHAAIVLGFGIFALLHEKRVPLPKTLTFTQRSLFLMLGACGIALLAGFLKMPILVILGLGFLSAAALLFLYGDSMTPTAVGFGLAFSGFTFLVVVFPFADWPLRLFAGQTAMWFLDLIGSTAELGFIGDPAKLILMHASRPFEVAPECNGFGLISGCILLAILLAFSGRLRLFDIGLVLFLAPMIGLIANALRIVVVVLLAPMAGTNYFLMHEAVGISFFLGALVLLWFLVRGLPARPPRTIWQPHLASP